MFVFVIAQTPILILKRRSKDDFEKISLCINEQTFYASGAWVPMRQLPNGVFYPLHSPQSFLQTIQRGRSPQMLEYACKFCQGRSDRAI
jgi:hypothetical protein